MRNPEEAGKKLFVRTVEYNDASKTVASGTNFLKRRLNNGEVDTRTL